MFPFQSTDVYKKSKFFHLKCKEILQKIRNDKSLADQLRRASLSIPLNIAEGSGKFSNPDRRNYFVIARASVFECVAIPDIIHAELKISDIEFELLEKNCEDISKMLFKMIKNLE